MPGLNMKLGMGITPSQGGAYQFSNQEAASLVQRMTKKPQRARMLLIDKLIGDLKSAGIFAKLDLLYILAAHDRQASLLNWVSNSYNLIEKGTIDWVVDRGYKGNNADFWLDSGFIPDDAGINSKYTSSNSVHGGVIQDPTSASNGVSRQIGGAGSQTNLNPRSNATNGISTRLNSGASQVYTASIEAAHWTNSRLDSTGYFRYKNGQPSGGFVSVPSVASDTTTTFGVCATHDTPTTINNPSIARHSAFYLGSGLSALQVENLYYSLNSYLSQIGAEQQANRTLTPTMVVT